MSPPCSRGTPTKNALVVVDTCNHSISATGLIVIRGNGVNKFSDTAVPFYNDRS